MTTVTTVKAVITADATKMKNALGNATRSVSDFGTSSIKTFGNVTKKFALLGGAIATGAVVIGKNMVDMAVDTEESINKASAVFGDAVDKIEKGALRSAELAGLNSAAYLESASNFGVFGKAAGLVGDDLANFSTDLVSLSADVASFNNLNPEDAVMKLSAGLRGEVEPLRAIGILMNAAEVEARALELGLMELDGELSESNKILARQSIIYEQLGSQGAVGDFAKTSEGLANKQRILKARLQNVGAELGKVLLPLANKLAEGFEFLIEKLAGAGPTFQMIVDKAKELGIKIFPVVRDAVVMVVEKIRALTGRIIDFVKANPKAVLAGLAVVIGGVLLASVIAIVTAIGSLVFSVGGLLVILGAATGAVVYFWKNNEKFRKTVLRVIEVTKKVAKVVKDAFVTAFEKASPVALDIFNRIKTVFMAMFESIKAVIAVFDALFRGNFSDVFRRLGTLVKTVVVGIVESFIAIPGKILKEALPPLITAMNDLLNKGIQLLASGAKEVGSEVLEGLVTLAKDIGGLAVDFLNAGLDIGRGLLDGMVNGIKSAGQFTLGLASDIVNAIAGFINDNLIHPFNDLLEFTIPIPFAPDIHVNPPDIPPIPPVGGGGGGAGPMTAGGIPKLAKGGIVTGPTLALIGEAGPEAVVPLNKANGFGGKTVNVTINMPAGVSGEQVVSAIEQYVRENGSAPIATTTFRRA